MEDKLVKRKGVIGACVLLRAETQHVTRSYLQIVNLTETHKQIMLQLFTLATSRYAIVQWQAQYILSRAFQYFPFSWKIVTPKLVDVLGEDPETDQDAYKVITVITMSMTATNFY